MSGEYEVLDQFEIRIKGDEDTSHFFIIKLFIDSLVAVDFAPREEIIEHLGMYAELGEEKVLAGLIA